MIPDGQISLQCQANYVIANPMSKAFPASVPSSASNKRNMLSSKQTQMRTPTSDLHNSFLVRNQWHLDQVRKAVNTHVRLRDWEIQLDMNIRVLRIVLVSGEPRSRLWILFFWHLLEFQIQWCKTYIITTWSSGSLRYVPHSWSMSSSWPVTRFDRACVKIRATAIAVVPGWKQNRLELKLVQFDYSQASSSMADQDV